MIGNRTRCESASVGQFTVTVDFDEDGHPFSAFFTARGKSGTELHDDLYELGVVISKIMQKEPI